MILPEVLDTSLLMHLSSSILLKLFGGKKTKSDINRSSFSILLARVLIRQGVGYDF